MLPDAVLSRTTGGMYQGNEAMAFLTACDVNGGPAVLLDGNARVADVELDAANNYNGAMLTLAQLAMEYP